MNLSTYILQGDRDQFYKDGQLLPEALQRAAEKAGFSSSQVNVRRQEGYDHSYYFVSCSYIVNLRAYFHR